MFKPLFIRPAGRNLTTQPVTQKTLEEAKDQYTRAMLGIYGMCAQLEIIVYEAHSEALKHGILPEDESARLLIRYYETFKRALDRTIDITEDVMMDYRMNMQHSCQALRKKTILSIGMHYGRLGFDKPYPIALLTGVTVFTEIIEKTWGILTNNIRKAVGHIPRYVSDAMLMFPLLNKHAIRLSEHIDPSLIGISVSSTEDTEDIICELVERIFDMDVQNRACYSSMTENGMFPEALNGKNVEEIESTDYAKT